MTEEISLTPGEDASVVDGEWVDEPEPNGEPNAALKPRTQQDKIARRAPAEFEGRRPPTKSREATRAWLDQEELADRTLPQSRTGLKVVNMATVDPVDTPSNTPYLTLGRFRMWAPSARAWFLIV